MYVTFAQLAFVSLVSVSFLSLLVGVTAFLSIMRQMRIARLEVVPVFADAAIDQPGSVTTLEHRQFDRLSTAGQRLKASFNRMVPQQIGTHLKHTRDRLSRFQPAQRFITTVKHSINLVVGRTKAG